MKKLISLIIGLTPLISMAQANHTYTIEGKVSMPATVILQYKLNEEMVKDSTEVNNGAYKLTGTVVGQVTASLTVQPHKSTDGRSPMGMMTNFWLEPGNIKVIGLLDGLNPRPEFSGTTLNDETNELTRELQPLGSIPVEQRGPQMEVIVIKFIKAHPNSMVSFDQLRYAISAIDPDAAVVEPLFNDLSAEIKASPTGKEFQQMLIKWKNVTIGSIAPDFTQPDTNGKTVSLHDFKGRYVLVDFWASWCAPCRAENPNVVKNFNLYKDKNFTILGISLDGPDGKDNWIKAIHDDKLTWTQVSDLQSWKNAAAQLYSVNSIPQNFLIDPSGKIIAKNLRGDDLDKKLASIFN